MQVKTISITENNLNIIEKEHNSLIFSQNLRLINKIHSKFGKNKPPIIWAKAYSIFRNNNIMLSNFIEQIDTIELTDDPLAIVNAVLKAKIHHSLFILFPIEAKQLLTNQFLLKLKQNLPPLSNTIILPTSHRTEILLLQTKVWLSTFYNCNFYLTLEKVEINTVKDNTIWEINTNTPTETFKKLNIKSSHINRLALVKESAISYPGYTLSQLYPNYLEVKGFPEEGRYYLTYPYPTGQIELFKSFITKGQIQQNNIFMIITKDLWDNFLFNEIEMLIKLLESSCSQWIIITPEFFTDLKMFCDFCSCGFYFSRW